MQNQEFNNSARQQPTQNKRKSSYQSDTQEFQIKEFRGQQYDQRPA